MKLFTMTDGQGHIEIGVRTNRGWDSAIMSPDETHKFICRLAKAYHEVTGSLPPPISYVDIGQPALYAKALAERKRKKK